MKIIINTHNSAYFNLALEEYLMTRYDERIFMLWTSVPSILIGRNQNTYTEINIPYVKTHDIPVVRRMSGGGTVFCDPGNINFTFIESDLGAFADFKVFTTPILEYLRTLGVNAEFSGRNDLVIEDRKFSGNAQYKLNNRILHHGTLLFSSSLSHLSKALTPRKEKFSDKSVSSVSSRVTNIKSHLQDQSLTVDSFRNKLYEYMVKTQPDSIIYELTDEDIKAVETLVEEKYNTWQWNYGDSPKYDFTNVKKFPGGLVELGLTVHKGKIKDMSLQGDFFGTRDIKCFCAELVGTPHEKNALIDKISKLPFDEYLKGFNIEDFVSFMTDF